MTIEKLPSGSYRIRQQYQGKRYSIVVDYKPSKKDAIVLLSERLNMPTIPQNAPRNDFNYYANKYLEKLKKDQKSPTTLRGYMSIQKNMPQWFKELPLYDITEESIKQLITEYSVDRAAKTVKSMSSFVHSILAEYRPEFTYKVKLPTRVKKAEYEPTTDDIKRLIEYTKDTKYSLAIQFACIGLRRGELCAITSADLDEHNVLTINKDKILNDENEEVIKETPKTDASNRRILIPDNLATQLREQGYIYNGKMNYINDNLTRYQKQLNIPHFRLHILRHFAAAYLLKKKNFTTTEIEDYMGWEHGSSVMQKVYAYNLDPHETQKEIANAFDGIF